MCMSGVPTCTYQHYLHAHVSITYMCMSESFVYKAKVAHILEIHKKLQKMMHGVE